MSRIEQRYSVSVSEPTKGNADGKVTICTWLEVCCTPPNGRETRCTKLLPQCYTFCYEWDTDCGDEYHVVECPDTGHVTPRSPRAEACGCVYWVICGEITPEIVNGYGSSGSDICVKPTFKWFRKCGTSVGGGGGGSAGGNVGPFSGSGSASAHGQAGVNSNVITSWVAFYSDFSAKGHHIRSGQSGGQSDMPEDWSEDDSPRDPIITRD